MQSIGNPGNQFAIMLIKTTATAPVGLGGLGGFVTQIFGLLLVHCTMYIVHILHIKAFNLVYFLSLFRISEAVSPVGWLQS